VKKLAVLFAAALLVAGCGGGTGAAPSGSPGTGTTTGPGFKPYP
jgi:ABC-type glycerol-3-phosphate transport system substrate-binding protein